jgi:hypothetical protein
MSTPPEPVAAAPSGRLQFSLRRLFLGVFVVALVAGAARWVYVRTIVQRETVRALHDLDIRVRYAWIWESTQPGEVYTDGGFSPRPGKVVKGVYLSVPFGDLEEARRVNRLLRTLPHLDHVSVSEQYSFQWVSSRPRSETVAELQFNANRHCALAIADLPLRGLFILSPSLDDDSLALVCESPSIEAVGFGPIWLPKPADLQRICEARHITRLSLNGSQITSKHLQVLETAQHLQQLQLHCHDWNPSIGPADLAALGELNNCDLQLLARNVSDSHIRDGIARLPNLTRLSLPFEAPADDAVAALAAAPRLRFLALQDATVSDQALIALAKSRSLEELNVAGTDVSEEALFALRDVPTLRLVTVSKSLDLDRLEAGLPNVEIAWGYVPSANHTQYRAERRASADAARAANVGH